ncbi:hypothetical protein BB561_000710 [Smittium simulii]|uniref:Vacuolar protein 14 C-terminal Fig4-binding domain-containing protein n=1 Tax=Smittium simulii TaxID=133385 RepID=A0A2T9YXT6_9FUNG|nr:hypothetical protein BB561_000710 [Smittium simulii]
MSIPIQISKGLVDKSYDKRKISALQLEDYLKELLTTDQIEPITYILLELSEEYLSSAKESTRAGAIMGLATCGIALGSENIVSYLELIVPPILSTLSDTEPKIRYYGCEALYNIAKVCRGLILGYFNQIMDMLSRVTADPMLSVKESANYVDRLIKDIVTEEATSYLSVQALQQKQIIPPSANNSNQKYVFSLETFIPLLSERMHTFKAATRLYLIEWIRVLDSVPGLDLIQFLPHFLDQLIRFLSDPKTDVRLKASNALSELLREVEEVAGVQEFVEDLWHDPLSENLPSANSSANFNNSARTPMRKFSGFNYPDFNTVGNASKELTMAARRKKIRNERRDFSGNSPNITSSEHASFKLYNKEIFVDHAACLEILAIHLHSNDQEILATALNWVGSFTFVCPSVVASMTPQLIHALLPLSSHTVLDICSMTLRINKRLQQLVCSQIPSNGLPKQSLLFYQPTQGNKNTSTSQSNCHYNAEEATGDIHDIQNTLILDDNSDFRLVVYEQIVAVIMVLFENNVNESTKVEGLKWLLLLHRFAPSKALSPCGIGFPFLLKALSDGSDNVVKLVLKLFAQIALSSSRSAFNLNSTTSSTIPYVSKFIESLIQTFHNNHELIQTRMPLIIRQLCLVLDPDQVFRIFSYHLHIFLVSHQLCYNRISPTAQFDTQNHNLFAVTSKLSRFSTLDSDQPGFNCSMYDNKSTKSDSDFVGNQKESENNINISTDISDLIFAQDFIKQLTWILACAKETEVLRENLPSKSFTSNNLNDMLSFDNTSSNFKIDKNYKSTDKSVKDLTNNLTSFKFQSNTKNSGQNCASEDLLPENSSNTSKNFAKNNQSNLVSKKITADSSNCTLKPLGTKGNSDRSKSPKTRLNQNKITSAIASDTEAKHSLTPANQNSLKILTTNELTSQLDYKRPLEASTQKENKLSSSPNPSVSVNKSKILNRLSRVNKSSRSSLNYSPTLNFSLNNKISNGSIAAALRSESPLTVYPILPSSVSKSINKQFQLSKSIEQHSNIPINDEMNILNNGLLPVENSRHNVNRYSIDNYSAKSNFQDTLEIQTDSKNLNNNLSALSNSFEKTNDEDLVILNSEIFNISLFEALFCSWACSPVSTLILCFLAQQYELSYNIIVFISSKEILLSLLKELDQLVQLLESPVFSLLRVQLLDQNKYPYLIASMYALLMILPQSVAFVMLKNRLNSAVNISVFNQGLLKNQNIDTNIKKKQLKDIDTKNKISNRQRSRQISNVDSMIESRNESENEHQYKQPNSAQDIPQQRFYDYYCYSQSQICLIKEAIQQNFSD